jgi:hypothetical protein
MAKKVVQLVGCCNECPNKAYYSGGRSECSAADTLLPFNEGHKIPEWCPLTDYPSDDMETLKRRIAELEAALAPPQPRSVQL